MSAWDVNLQLEAWRQQRAVAKTATWHVQVNENAMVLCPLQMAGWDPSLMAVMTSTVSGKPRIRVADDPRSYASQLTLYAELGRHLNAWANKLYQRGEGNEHAQLIVPSRSAATALRATAYRLAWMKNPGGSDRSRKDTIAARELGRLLLHFTARMDHPGQQSLIVASEQLAHHFAVGQDPTDHLGVLLCWITATGNQPLTETVLQRVTEPMGSKTDAEFDRTVLAPLMNKAAKAISTNNRGLISVSRRNIERELEPVLQKIHDATTTAITILTQPDRSPLPGLDELISRDLFAFHQHMSHLHNDGQLARNDNIPRSIRTLASFEDAAELWNTLQTWGDPLLWAKATITGDVLEGAAVEKDAHRSVISSTQPVLRVRLGDKLVERASGQNVLVEAISRTETTTDVTVRGSQPLFGPVQLAAGKPDFLARAREMKTISRRLTQIPETHTPAEGAPPPMPELSQNADDPLAAVEALVS